MGWQEASLISEGRTGERAFEQVRQGWLKAIRAQFNNQAPLRAGYRVDDRSERGYPACEYDEDFVIRDMAHRPNWRCDGMALSPRIGSSSTLREENRRLNGIPGAAEARL